MTEISCIAQKRPEQLAALVVSLQSGKCESAVVSHFGIGANTHVLKIARACGCPIPPVPRGCEIAIRLACHAEPIMDMTAICQQMPCLAEIMRWFQSRLQ